MPHVLGAWIVAASLTIPLAASPQECLHGSNETTEQAERRKAALSAARQVNTLQARGSVARRGKYLSQLEMSELYAEELKKRPAPAPLAFDRSGEIVSGWTLTFDLTESGYWFMIRDRTDPCGFAYISNQEGVIYTASVMR